MSGRIRKTLGGLAAACAVATTALVGGAGEAAAAPTLAAGQKVPVWHLPATGITESGLLVPIPWAATVYAQDEGPGKVRLSVDGGSMCSTNAAYQHVQIHWVNTTTGRAGLTAVKPCKDVWPEDPELSKIAHTGPGPVAISVVVPGRLSIPGAGGFVTP